MRPYPSRTAVVSALALLLAGGPAVGAAVAAAPVQASARAHGAVTAPAAKPKLTAKASVKSVRAWQQFRVSGSSTNLRAGTRVTLQQLQGKKWKSLPASMNTNRSGAYNLRVQLGIKGVNKLRIVGGGATSNTVTVTVR
ncbi:hypothetical protein [Streptomyces sp. NPDC060194]|uniref:hypothetical protein n=1 Tax=Streptomyces sp. NPDC060194 TaxID=3347069 RepID=UPI0036508F7E